jgi:serine/threonine protein kinase
MARVYKATLNGRLVVIKRALADLARNPSFTRMLLREARLSALLDHPGIVRLLEAGEVKGEPFLALEYLDGYDLATVLEHCIKVNVTLPVPVLLEIATALGAALGYAHRLRGSDGASLGLVHRDVSPANIMITVDGLPKLLDFGVAKAVDALQGDVTRTEFGGTKGKVSYFSPEQADGKPIDGRTDLFALGVVLLECVCLRRIFRGHDDLDTLRKVRETRVPEPRSVRPDLPEALEKILLRLVAQKPADRFQTGEELVAALAPLRQSDSSHRNEVRSFIASLGPIRGKRRRSSTNRSSSIEKELATAVASPRLLEKK